MDLSGALCLDRLKAILAEAQTVWPEAVIAGGALRDWHMGRGPRDVDIFVPAGSIDWPMGWYRTAFCPGGPEYREAFREEVVGFSGFEIPGCPWPIQVIELNHDGGPGFWEYVVSRMDFDFCRFAMPTPDGTMLTPEAVNAFRNKKATLLLCPDEASAKRSLRRAEKFRERYPDWTFDLSVADWYVSETLPA